jgi:hypothetical protein
MLGGDKSRGYCLEMICADFLAGEHLDSGQSKVSLKNLSRYSWFLPLPEKMEFVQTINKQLK